MLHSCRLVYHDPSNPQGDVSPFDQAIMRVSNAGALRIASPYVGVSYLERIIRLSNDWRLISDVSEWLKSLSVSSRPRAWTFIRENIANIHHCPALHAKVVVGPLSAYTGSANLTSAGIQSRTEMGVLIESPELVAELNEWFDTLWGSTSSPDLREADEYVRWLDDEAKVSVSRRQQLKLSGAGRQTRASLLTLGERSAAKVDSLGVHDSPIANAVSDILVRENRNYASLNEAVDALLLAKGGAGFTLAEACQFVRLTLGACRVREVYSHLARRTANHATWVFSGDNSRELLYLSSKFSLSNSELLVSTLSLWDDFLAQLISSLSTTEYRALPYSTFFRESGIRPFAIDQMVTMFLEEELLELQDLAGEVPQFRVSSEFDWVGHFAIFKRSQAAWDRLAKSRPVEPKPIVAASMVTPHDVPKPSGGRRADAPPVAPPVYDEAKERLLIYALNRISETPPLSTEDIRTTIAQWSRECRVEPRLVKDVFLRKTDPQLLRITSSIDRKVWRIDVNPALTWGSLENYPALKRECERLLGL